MANYGPYRPDLDINIFYIYCWLGFGYYTTRGGLYMSRRRRTGGLAVGDAHERDGQLLANSSGSKWVDFPVPGNGSAPTFRRIFPNGVVAALPEKPATVPA